mmetsp:Transcript_30061/g.59491  ORF Transcript_30061/g.59491 Transcript_30061/m.59491 type:complete len:86 (-) Transcript_30061:514-771(-)
MDPPLEAHCGIGPALSLRAPPRHRDGPVARPLDARRRGRRLFLFDILVDLLFVLQISPLKSSVMPGGSGLTASIPPSSPKSNKSG